jgi:hypothetical protein
MKIVPPSSDALRRGVDCFASAEAVELEYSA